MTNKPATKLKSPKVVKVSQKLKVVDIENWGINKYTKEIRQQTNNIRHLFVIMCMKDGTIKVKTTMSDSDTLYHLERCKQLLL